MKSPRTGSWDRRCYCGRCARYFWMMFARRPCHMNMNMLSLRSVYACYGAYSVLRRTTWLPRACVHFASKILRGCRRQVSALQSVTMIEYSPEKAGVGGSTPSLATTFNNLARVQNRIHQLFTHIHPHFLVPRPVFIAASSKPVFFRKHALDQPALSFHLAFAFFAKRVSGRGSSMRPGGRGLTSESERGRAGPGSIDMC
jgi:hypothetical protein